MSRPVSVEVDGRLVHGTYSLDGRPLTIRVEYEGEAKETLLGDTPALVLARILLTELVREG